MTNDDVIIEKEKRSREKQEGENFQVNFFNILFPYLEISPFRFM